MGTGERGPGYLFYISDLDYGEPGTFNRIEKSKSPAKYWNVKNGSYVRVLYTRGSVAVSFKKVSNLQYVAMVTVMFDNVWNRIKTLFTRRNLR